MPLYDSADCLSQFNLYAGRSESNDSITDANKYLRLSRAQQSVISDVMTVAPKSLSPKVPYTLFPQPADNSFTVGSGTVTLSGASFAAGASITATASVAQFSAGLVGRTYIITDPFTNIPMQFTVATYSSTTVVTMTASVAVPTTMQAVAISGWALVNATYPDGQLFTFGENANGYPIMPMGKALIFPSLASWPNFPWIEGLDYISEGTQIRLPNNRTWSGPLYWYGVPQPNNISASVEPALFPEGSRELIVFRAVAMFCDEGFADEKLAAKMEGRYQQAFTRWCLAWKTQFSDGGAMGSISGLRIAEAGGSLNGNNWSAG